MEDPQRNTSIRVLMMPRDTNPAGTIFGGVILSHIDQAGAEESRLHGADRVVTVAMKEVEFHEPVFVGDLVSFYTSLVRCGRTSVAGHHRHAVAPPHALEESFGQIEFRVQR